MAKAKSKARATAQPVPSAPPAQSIEIPESDHEESSDRNLRNGSRPKSKSISKAHSTGKKCTASTTAPPPDVEESETGESSGHNLRSRSRSLAQPSSSISTPAPADDPAAAAGTSGKARKGKRKASPEPPVARKRGRLVKTAQLALASVSAGPSRQQPGSAPRQTKLKKRGDKMRQFKQEEELYQNELDRIQQEVSELHGRLDEHQAARTELAKSISDAFQEIITFQRTLVELSDGKRKDSNDKLKEAKEALRINLEEDNKLQSRIHEVLFHLDSLVAQYDVNFIKLENAMDLQLLLQSGFS